MFSFKKKKRDLGQKNLLEVERICCKERELRNRLLAFGIVPGRKLSLKHFAPFGGNFCVKILNYFLSLTCQEGECIKVRESGDSNSSNIQGEPDKEANLTTECSKLNNAKQSCNKS